MALGFKAYEKLFKKYESPEAAVKEGKAIDFLCNEGYNHVKDISLHGEKFRLLSFEGFEGSYVIPNCLSRGVQLELINHCLSDCLKPENKTNLHGHTDSSIISSQLSDLWARESVLIDSLEGDPCSKLPKTAVLSNIRWVTLGYQYDWTARKYVREQFAPFPSKLAALCSIVGDLVGDGYSIKPDAAIVNFYPEGAVMGGHIDDAELTYNHPVISISIGCPCLFLLGGFDKSADPLPMILRSGDILIMGGKSRLRVHAVPKVFTKSLPPTYLHPRTAGSQRIHMEDCTCFLKRHLSTMDCVDSTGASGSDLLITTCQKRYSIECFDNQETKIWSKRQRSASIGESLTENVTLEENKKCEKETYVRNNRNNEQCSCNSLSIQGEVRALRYLQTTRININVRQVYSNTKL